MSSGSCLRDWITFGTCWHWLGHVCCLCDTWQRHIERYGPKFVGRHVTCLYVSSDTETRLVEELTIWSQICSNYDSKYVVRMKLQHFTVRKINSLTTYNEIIVVYTKNNRKCRFNWSVMKDIKAWTCWTLNLDGTSRQTCLETRPHSQILYLAFHFQREIRNAVYLRSVAFFPVNRTSTTSSPSTLK